MGVYNIDTVLWIAACIGGGTKDARDMRVMEKERRRRAGEEDTGTWQHQPGAFEKYTKVSLMLSCIIAAFFLWFSVSGGREGRKRERERERVGEGGREGGREGG